MVHHAHFLKRKNIKLPSPIFLSLLFAQCCSSPLRTRRQQHHKTNVFCIISHEQNRQLCAHYTTANSGKSTDSWLLPKIASCMCSFSEQKRQPAKKLNESPNVVKQVTVCVINQLVFWHQDTCSKEHFDSLKKLSKI